MNLFGNISIGKRLALGFTILLLGAALIAGIAVARLSTMASTTRTMMAEPLYKERLVSDWYRTIYASIRRNTAVAKSSDANLASHFAKENADASKDSLAHKQMLEPLLRTAEEKQIFARLLDIRQQFVATRDAIGTAKLAGHFDEADRILATDFTTAANGYQQALNDLLKLQRDNLNQLAADIQESEVQSRYFFIAFSAILLALGALLAWRTSVSITRPLHRAVGVAETVAAGDLSTTITATTTDETGKLLQSLATMNDNLLSVVNKIRHGTDTIHTASSELAHGNLDLSSRTEEQASSLEETASAMEELTTTVRQNADNAKQANQLAANASHIATEGGNAVDKVIHTMNDIHEASKKIVDIISVIDGIAFQTNILALNAAVEAARAGEQGRGFAVVASEVRSLAQRSASAAKEIKQLIDDSVSKVDAGSQYVDEAGQTMQQVVASIRRVTDIVAEISAASQEQSAGIEQVNQAIAQMDEVTQQNAALVEQATAATQSMQIEATTLANIVNTFKISNVDTPVTVAVAKTPTFNAVTAAAKRSTMSPAPSRQPAKLPASINESNDWEEF